MTKMQLLDALHEVCSSAPLQAEYSMKAIALSRLLLLFLTSTELVGIIKQQ